MPARLLKRWRAQRRASPLTASSPEGAYVHATGIARALHDDVFVPSLAGVSCVVAWTKFYAGNAQNPRNPALEIERLLIRPFVLETAQLRIVIDASHVELLFPVQSEGNTREISIAVGAAITVFGTVLRDGVVRPDGNVAFREATPACKLVGNKRYPVVIAP